MRRLLLLWLATALVLAGCSNGGDDKKAAPRPPAPTTGADADEAPLALTSPAFQDGGALPTEITCDGDGRLPALEWSGVPAGAAELALVVTDPDAPGGGFLHLAAFGLDPGRTNLDGDLPAGARLAANSSGSTGWTPPCPPKGDKGHRYHFDLLVLREPTGIEAGAEPGEVDDAYDGKVVASARLTGTYER